MKVALIHNHYRQPGGEDLVCEAEAALLRRAGHCVTLFTRDNKAIADERFTSRVRLSVNTIWARDTYKAVRELLAAERHDIAHFHNTFPLISPAAYYACRDAGVPVVQTLHNYRLLCPAATFYRDGHVCEDCIGHLPWQGVVHGCYRNSRRATLAVAGMLSFHRWRGTWLHGVNRYIALTEFARGKFIEGGLSPQRIVIKPNFLADDPGPRIGPGESALFLGRLSSEKGIATLVRSWARLSRGIPLVIAGDGPLRAELEKEVAGRGIAGVRFVGHLPREEVVLVLKRSRFLVLPSEWYEGFPLTILEALACAVPVIVPRLGAAAEIVENGRTGLHFVPGDADDLAAKVEWAWTHPDEMDEMGRAARVEYETKYTAERNYVLMMQIYEQALGAA